MSGLRRFLAAHPKLSRWLASLVIVPLLVYGCDKADKLTGAEIEDLLVDEPVLYCLANGEPLTEYFASGGAYRLDLPGSAQDRFGRWQIDGHDRICIALEGAEPDCRYVWRDGETLIWMWVNPARFASITFFPEDPCTLHREQGQGAIRRQSDPASSG